MQQIAAVRIIVIRLSVLSKLPQNGPQEQAKRRNHTLNIYSYGAILRPFLLDTNQGKDQTKLPAGAANGRFPPNASDFLGRGVLWYHPTRNLGPDLR